MRLKKIVDVHRYIHIHRRGEVLISLTVARVTYRFAWIGGSKRRPAYNDSNFPLLDKDVKYEYSWLSPALMLIISCIVALAALRDYAGSLQRYKLCFSFASRAVCTLFSRLTIVRSISFVFPVFYFFLFSVFSFFFFSFPSRCSFFVPRPFSRVYN